MVGIPLEKPPVESRRRRIIARARQDGGRLQQHGRHRPALGRAVDGTHRRPSCAGDIPRLQQALRQEQRRILLNRRRPPHRIPELPSRLPRLPRFHEREPRGEPVAQLRRKPHDRSRRNTRRRRGSGRCRRHWPARHRRPAVREDEPASKNPHHPTHRSQSNKPSRASADGSPADPRAERAPSRRPSVPVARALERSRWLRKVQMRGGARRQPARRTQDGRAAAGSEASGYGSPGERERATLSRLPRAPYLRRWAFMSHRRGGRGGFAGRR